MTETSIVEEFGKDLKGLTNDREISRKIDSGISTIATFLRLELDASRTTQLNNFRRKDKRDKPVLKLALTDLLSEVNPPFTITLNLTITRSQLLLLIYLLQLLVLIIILVLILSRSPS